MADRPLQNTMSYPPVAVKPWKPFPIRPFLPIYPPPDLVDYPCLPCSPRAQPFSTFSLSTHIVPAVHLRRGPCIPVPDLPLKDEGFEKLREEFQRNARDPDVQDSKHENILWNVVNRYVHHRLAKTTNSSGLVLFFAPAGGLPKEVALLSLMIDSGFFSESGGRFGNLSLLVFSRPLLL